MTPGEAARTLAGRSVEARNLRSRESRRIAALPSGVRVEVFVPHDWLKCPARDLRLAHEILCLIEAYENASQPGDQE